MLALLAWPMIWKLSMKRHEKIGVAIAMSLGIVAGLVGVIKVVKIASIAEGGDIPCKYGDWSNFLSISDLEF